MKLAGDVGADQPEVSKIMNGKLDEFSIERITECMQKLGNDIHISPSPKSKKLGTVDIEQRNAL